MVDDASVNGYSVGLSNVSIPVFLFKTNPNFDNVLHDLKDALKEKQRIWVASIDTRDHNHTGHWEILEVLGKVRKQRNSCFHPVEVQFDESRFCPVRPDDAQQIYEDMLALSTDPDTYPNEGIPFLYLDTGCTQRASEMCRLIKKRGVEPFKIWAFKNSNGPPLRVQTINHPNCSAQWSFHVAPMIMTTDGFYVVDPAIAHNAITVERWVNLFSNGDLRLYSTSADIYQMTADQRVNFFSDPFYEATARELENHRRCLQLFSIRFGKPPYGDCLHPNSATP